MDERRHYIFTDGSSLGNPGPGGWGAVLVLTGRRVIEMGGHHEHTTNNRMELTAVVEGLTRIRHESGDVSVLLDSTYVEKGASVWMAGWKRRGWKTLQKTDVEHRDLWEELSQLLEERKRTGTLLWHHVSGHSGVVGNERVDAIATGYAKEEEVELYEGDLGDYAIDVLNIDIDEEKSDMRRAAKARAKAKAYSYLSLVGGVAKRHSTWAECEKRVLGKTKVKFKKALSPSDESAILRSWGVKL